MKFAWYLVLLLLFVTAAGALGAEAADAAAKEGETTPWYLVLLTTLGVLSVPLLPYILGGRIANALRMKDYGWKVGLILATLTSGIVVLVMGWPPKLGIDLSSGVILVYEIDPEASQQMKKADEDQEDKDGERRDKKGTGITISELVPTLKKRIDPTGVKEIVVRPYGPRQVEIIIPNMAENDVEEIKKSIITAGHLRFRIAADTQKDTVACSRAKNNGDLRDDPRGLHVAVKNTCITRQAGHTLLDACPARVDKPDHGCSHLEGHILDFHDLFCMDRTQ